jgi:hypothetical protein
MSYSVKDSDHKTDFQIVKEECPHSLKNLYVDELLAAR